MKNPIYSVGFVADGESIYTSGPQATVRMHNAADGRLICEFRGGEDEICWIALSPDGRYAATGSRDNAIRIFDRTTTEQLRVIHGHDSWVWGVEFSPDGRRLYSASRDKTVAVWSVPDGKLLIRRQLHDNEINGLAVSGDGRLIATAADDHSVLLCDPTLMPVRSLVGHMAMVNRVRFLAGDQQLVSCDTDGAVILWSVPTGELLGAFYDHGGGPGSERPVWALATSPGTDHFMSAGADGHVVVRQGCGRDPVARSSCAGTTLLSLAIDPKGRWIIAGSDEGAVLRWDTRWRGDRELSMPSAVPVALVGALGSRGIGAMGFNTGVDSGVKLKPLLAQVNAETPDPEDPRAEPVDCSVFAPPQVSCEDHFMVQVFAHRPPQWGVVANMAQAYDERARRRGTKRLALDIPYDTTLQVQLRMPGLVIDEPVQSLRWQDDPEAVQFDVFVPPEMRTPHVIGTVLVSQEGIPVGNLKFTVTIRGPRRPRAPLQSAGVSTCRYRRAFTSYASQDREEVLPRVQMLRSVGIECFMDVLSLEPGQRWEKQLYRHIDECDLFLLFWSSNAQASAWVQKEIDYAMARKKGSPDAPPEIQPVIIEGPPVPLPPPVLADLHFNDYVIYLTCGGGPAAASRQASRQLATCPKCGDTAGNYKAFRMGTSDAHKCLACGFKDYEAP